MSLYTTLTMAAEALRRNVIRTALTTLGIIIGVAAVIVMMAIGDGARESIEARIRSTGTNQVVVMAGSANVGGVRLGQGGVTTLVPDDAEAIRALPNVQMVSPGLNTRAQVVTAGANWSTQIQGVGADFLTIREWPAEHGAFFADIDVTRSRKVAMLGSSVRDQLFGAGADPTGASIRLNNQPFTVIGVLTRKGQSAFGQDQDDVVLVPYTAVQKRLMGVQHISNITVSAVDGASLPQLSASIATALRERHRLMPGEPDDFNVRSFEEMASVLTSTTTTMTYLLASVAAVSLLVGGIGIMNIMLVSVTERTREIGLRLSIGARRRDVLRQFLVEALVLSLGGGLAGIALGVSTSYAVNLLLHWSMRISPNAVALSFGCAATIGVLFGLFPARRAAALSPMEALRYE
jgi:putative ABC transport system permease protein